MTTLQLLTASNTGVVKICSIDLQKNVKRLLHTWGTPDLQNEVDAVAWVNDENTQLAMAAKSGHVRVWDMEDGHVISTDHRSVNRIRGLSVHDARLWTCDASGQVTASPVTALAEHSTRALIQHANPNKSAQVVDKWLANPAHTRAVVVSKGHVPSVWSLDALPSEYRALWTAKNVGNDWLDVHVALSDSDVTWVDDVTHQFVICTLTGQIRTYDTRAQRRPVADWALGASRADRSAGPDSTRDQFPLSLVRWSAHHSQQLVVADPLGSVWVVDRREGRAESIDHRRGLSYHKGGWKRGPCAPVVARLEGLTGAARDIQWAPDGTHLAAVGLDRFIHIWKADSYTSAGTIYTKLRLNRVLFMAHEEPVAPPQSEAPEVAEEAELWESIPVIEEQNKKRKRQSSRADPVPAKKQRVESKNKSQKQRAAREESDSEDEGDANDSFMFNQFENNNNHDDDEDLPVKTKKSFGKNKPRRNK